jgi:hypothetical protein
MSVENKKRGQKGLSSSSTYVGLLSRYFFYELAITFVIGSNVFTIFGKYQFKFTSVFSL